MKIIKNTTSAEQAAGSKKRKLTRVALLLVGVLLLAVVAIGLIRSTPTAQGLMADVKVTPVAEQVITSSYKISGVLSPNKTVTVTSKVSGTVNRIVEKGDLVKTGEVIAQLDDTDVQLQVGQTRSGLGKDVIRQLELAYNLAEDTYQKNKVLYDSGAISQMQLEQYQVQRDTAKLQYETAANMLNTLLARTMLKSPIGGIVITKNVQAGETVAPGTPVVSIVSMDPVILKGNIPEAMVELVESGQEVQVQVDALPGVAFKGKVSFISPVSVPTGQFFPVEISIANPEGVLKAGMTACSYIKVGSSGKRVAIPGTAVFERDGQKYVYVVSEGKAKRVPVITGLQDENYVEILEGLKTGEQVISTGANQVQDGDMVNISTGP
jgi:RND family efflux transporter MFP subunit